MDRAGPGHPVGGIVPLDDERTPVTEPNAGAAGQDPQQPTDDEGREQSGHATGFGGAEGRSGIDTGGANDDLHGQAREVAESGQGPGPAETPGA